MHTLDSRLLLRLDQKWKKVDHCFDLASSKRVFGMRHFFSSLFILAWLDRQLHQARSTTLEHSNVHWSITLLTLDYPALRFALLLSWLEAIDCVFAGLSLAMTPSIPMLLPSFGPWQTCKTACDCHFVSLTSALPSPPSRSATVIQSALTRR